VLGERLKPALAELEGRTAATATRRSQEAILSP
jgi:hypothetical protein